MTPDGALTVDLEDWRCALHPHRFTSPDNRPSVDAEFISRNTESLLGLLDDLRARATFFVPGEVARAVPETVQEIVRRGHEIGSHAPVHLPLGWIPRHKFEQMLTEDVEYVQDLTGVRQRGFRAPYFSLGRDEGWVLETLVKHGFWYDSSIVPTWTPYWGIPSAPKTPYLVDATDVSRESPNGMLLEIPVSVWPTWNHLPGLPVGGGFYMRVWPLPVLKGAYRRIIAGGRKLVLYIHLGNLEEKKERISGLTIRDVLSQYFVSERGGFCFNEVARDFTFDTIETVFRPELSRLRRTVDGF